ncbi:hypothetical protein SCP_1402610 [Sparassis crispa]|uniref:Uncharacterized protein n=1 Tax=Sparassis crispa TaxID=139825 RepID=A0A401H374_9APHY|nr:hypothetical protein SCP_1402610 [Sparassis crispa]GBE88853.1 hypothetical protein SCP_1402610 [Sparassis crispa]
MDAVGKMEKDGYILGGVLGERFGLATAPDLDELDDDRSPQRSAHTGRHGHIK